MSRYNIALIPTQDREQFVQYAQKLSRTAPSHSYHIGGEHSIPHISLCHFDADTQDLEEIWQQVLAIEIPRMQMVFDHHRSKSYPEHPHLCWVSLMSDDFEDLKDYHLAVAEIIKVPLNAAFEHFDPHMTLFNSEAESACAEFNQHPSVTPVIEDSFVVALGPVDNVGQITRILYSANPFLNYGSKR